MTDDKLRERLLRTETRKSYLATNRTAPVIVSDYEAPINPDGPEAVAELDRLEAENARKSALLDQVVSALTAVSKWREDCHAHDADMGHDLRDFDGEDWDMVEAYARQALATYRESVGK